MYTTMQMFVTTLLPCSIKKKIEIDDIHFPVLSAEARPWLEASITLKEVQIVITSPQAGTLGPDGPPTEFY